MHDSAYTKDVWLQYEADEQVQAEQQTRARIEDRNNGKELECAACGRAYIDDFEERSSRWIRTHYCSQYCDTGARNYGYDPERRFKDPKQDPFEWLLGIGERLYSNIRGEHNVAAKHDGYQPQGIHWRGHHWAQADPFKFASDFFDQAMQNMIADADERRKFMEQLCEAANFVRYGGN